MPPEWFEVGSQHSLTRQHQRFRNAEQLARIPCFAHATRAVQNKKWEASSDQAVIVEKLHPSKDCRVHLRSFQRHSHLDPRLFCLLLMLSTPIGVRIDIANIPSCASSSRQRDFPNGRSIRHLVQPPQRIYCATFDRKSRKPFVIGVHEDRSNFGGLAIVMNSVDGFPDPVAFGPTSSHMGVHASVAPKIE